MNRSASSRGTSNALINTSGSAMASSNLLTYLWLIPSSMPLTLGLRVGVTGYAREAPYVRPILMPAQMPEHGYGGLDGEPESGPACNVEREVSAYVNARQADNRHRSGNSSAPGRAQSWEGGRAQGDRHARVP